MPAPEWPASLPQVFQSNGFRMTTLDNRIFSRNEVGPPNVRPRASGRYRNVTGRMLFTAAQRDTFWDFYYDDLASGSLSFDLPDPYDPEVEVIRVRYSKDGPPSEETDGADNWFIAMSLDVMP